MTEEKYLMISNLFVGSQYKSVYKCTVYIVIYVSIAVVAYTVEYFRVSSGLRRF